MTASKRRLQCRRLSMVYHVMHYMRLYETPKAVTEKLALKSDGKEHYRYVLDTVRRLERDLGVKFFVKPTRLGVKPGQPMPPWRRVRGELQDKFFEVSELIVNHRRSR